MDGLKQLTSDHGIVHIISLGGGVQSTTLALMAAIGELTPIPHEAIFADTHAEPTRVYQHIAWLESVLPFPVRRVCFGDLRSDLLAMMAGERRRREARPPFFTAGGGMVRRQCTANYKIVPIQRRVRELLGLRRGQRWPREVRVHQWIGISLDEAHRMKPARVPSIQNVFPLIGRGMRRSDCIAWLEAHGYPKPPKSACTFCPYHDDRLWRDMRDNDIESWLDAVRVDEAIRAGIPGPSRPDGEGWFLHRSRIPLAQVDLSTLRDHGQSSLWGNECEGMCGV